ncbi:T9SS type A sorting domain-containing protein [candidate division WOR-3 bacterium]|nr:T9SS type A sorting domain-containing protein [candidate division WOR-3 bacterium]
MRCLLFVLTVLVVPILGFGDWDVEIPYADSSGVSAAIAVDSNNIPHILYLVSGEYFYHVYKSGGIWYGPYPIESVNYFTFCRMVDVAMVRDTLNAIMSLEYMATGDYLVWGKHLGGGVWATEQVPNTVAPSGAGGYLNVAISPGMASTSFHVIYVHYNYGSSILYYRKYDSTWTNADTVSFVPDVSSGWQHDVAVDANDDPHVTFLYSDEGIKYRKKTGNVWDPVELVSSATDPSFTAIAIDASNYPHLAYDKDDFGAVCYRTKTASGWQPEETVGTGGGWNTYGASIAVAGGEEFIAYYAEGDLKFATHTAGGWVSEDVDTAGNVGTHTSLAVDSEGYAHIAYRDADNELLKYAKSTEPVVGIAESEWNSEAAPRGLSITAYPNPFHHSTVIRCQTPDNRRKPELAIFDATGRVIVDLSEQVSVIGDQLSVEWDGADGNGRLMGSGVYFVRCSASLGSDVGGDVATRKLLLMR